MKSLLIIVLACLSIQLGGCASGKSYKSIVDDFPPIPAGEGRIFFYRDNRYTGSGIQPDIDLDGEKVGKSKPGGFFFIDRTPGAYEVSTSTEKEYAIQVDVEAEKTVYVRTNIAWGVWVGRVRPVLEDEEKAMKLLPKMKYIGYIESLGGKPRKN